MNRSVGRPAFSLIELVVVLGILAVLMGLTLSAVQRARESANQASCANNLRQFGLALTLYHDANGLLPPGVSATELNTSTMSWGAFIVPYLEQDSLAKEIRSAVPQIRKGNVPAFLFGTVIPVFGCPSDAFAKTPHDFVGDGLVAYTSYLGVEGTSVFRKDGCLYEDSEVRWTDIGDGTSNTLLVGERPAAVAHPEQCYSIWYMGLFGQHASWPTGSGNKLETATSCSSVLGVREVILSPFKGCKREPTHFGPGRLYNQCDQYHFWSLHGGGANFLFADGSVRFLSYSADNVLPALATRAGGEVVGDY